MEELLRLLLTADSQSATDEKLRALQSALDGGTVAANNRIFALTERVARLESEVAAGIDNHADALEELQRQADLTFWMVVFLAVTVCVLAAVFSWHIATFTRAMSQLVSNPAERPMLPVLTNDSP